VQETGREGHSGDCRIAARASLPANKTWSEGTVFLAERAPRHGRSRGRATPPALCSRRRSAPAESGGWSGGIPVQARDDGGRAGRTADAQCCGSQLERGRHHSLRRQNASSGWVIATTTPVSRLCSWSRTWPDQASRRTRPPDAREVWRGIRASRAHFPPQAAAPKRRWLSTRGRRPFLLY
jgi:hypothetical protein